MVQITKTNFLGAFGPAGGPSPNIVGDPQAVNNAEILNKGLQDAADVALEIKDTSDEMAMQSALTEAEFTFGRQANDRANQKYLDDGTPGYSTLDADLAEFSKTTKQRVLDRVPTNKRDKFNVLFDSHTTKKRLQAQGIARAQQIEIATGEFAESLETLKKTASLRENRSTLQDHLSRANSLIDSAVSGGLIDPKVGVVLKKTTQSDITTNVLKQSIEEDAIGTYRALTSTSAGDLGVDESRRQELIARAKSTATANRQAQQTASLQQVTILKNKISDIENTTADNIEKFPVANQSDGFTVGRLNIAKDKIVAESVLHSVDDIRTMSQVDPLRAAQMLMEQESATRAATDAMHRLDKKHRERNKEERELQDSYRSTLHRKKHSLPVSDKEAQTAWAIETRGKSNIDKRSRALHWGVSQPVFASEILNAFKTGDVNVLADSVDDNGVPVEGYMSTYSSLMRTNPKVLSSLSETDHERILQVKKALEAGIPKEEVSRVVQEEMFTEDTPEKKARRKEWGSKKAGGILRKNATDNLVRKYTSMFNLVTNEEEMSETLRDRFSILSETGYEKFGDVDKAVDWSISQMPNSGITEFPVADSGYFSARDALMLNTPEKVFGVKNAEEAKLLSNFFQNEVSTMAGALGHTSERVRIQEDNQTGETGSWRTFVETDNGTEVELPRWRLPSREELEKFATIKATVDKVQSFDNPEFKKEQLAKGRERVGESFTEVGKTTTDVTKYIAGGLGEIFKEFSTVEKDPTTKGKSKSTEPSVVRDLIAPSAVMWTIPFMGVMNKLIDILSPDEAEGATFDSAVNTFGKMAIESPTQADEMIDDWMMEGDEEVSVDDIMVSDGVVNVTGKTVEDIAIESFPSHLVTDDLRKFLPGRPESRQTPNIDPRILEAMSVAHDLDLSPKEVIKHSSVMNYLKSLPNEEKTAQEKEYELDAALVEEKTGVSTTPMSTSSPASKMSGGRRTAANPRHQNLVNHLIKSEQYRSVVYRDSRRSRTVNGKTVPFKGFLTIGIGWNIHPGTNDPGNEEMINWLNSINAGGKGKQYSLKSLQDGTDVIEWPDALRVMNRQIEMSEKSAVSIFGKDRFNSMSEEVKSVITDLHFQNGVAGFKKFTNTIKNLKKSASSNISVDEKNKMLAEGAYEIVNSTAFKSQTPVRFARHWARIINSSTMSTEDKKEQVKRVKDFANKHMTKRSTNPNIDIPKQVNAVFDSVL